jgi:hypothetical protein
MTSPNPLIASLLAKQTSAPIDTVNAPALTSAIAMPDVSSPSLGSSIAPAQTTVNPFPNQLQTDQTSRNRLINSGDGVSQISNPLLRGIARAADIAGTVFAPNLARAIPGTMLHHNMLVNQATQNVAQDQAQQQAATTLQDSQAQVQQRQALAQQEQAKATALANPKPLPVDKPENLQQEYADAVTAAIHGGNDPAHDPQVQQLADAITSLQRQPAAKEANKDDKYIAINAKLAAGQALTPDEQSFKSGYEHYVKVNKIDPAAVRVTAMMQMPQAIVDPNDPSREIYTTRKGAIGQQAAGSGDAQAARKADLYFTTGKGGQTLNAFNTAQTHLQILGQAAEALHNGNSTLLNGAANSFAKATGNPAPTNFDAVKNAVQGEIAKALTGNVTVSEQAELQKDMNNASSPAQIQGIVQKYTALMQGKKNALHQQYTDAKQGQASFGDDDQKVDGHWDPVAKKVVYH